MKYDLAISDFDKAIQLEPENPMAYRNRGRSYRDQKQYDQAIASHTQAIELDPQYVPAYYDRGVVYVDKEQFEEAIQDFTKTIQLDNILQHIPIGELFMPNNSNMSRRLLISLRQSDSIHRIIWLTKIADWYIKHQVNKNKRTPIFKSIKN